MVSGDGWAAGKSEPEILNDLVMDRLFEKKEFVNPVFFCSIPVTSHAS